MTATRRRPAGQPAFLPAPTEYADYSTPSSFVSRVLRVPLTQLDELIGSSIPSRTGPTGERLYEFADVYNLVASTSNGLSVFELGLRFLMRFAAEEPPSWYSRKGWRVTLTPPAGVQLKARALDWDSPLITRREQEPSSALDADYYDLDPNGTVHELYLAGAPDQINHAEALKHYTDVLDALVEGTVCYQTVPERLRAEPEVAWSFGIADCVVASKILANRLNAIGLQARARRGYLLGLLGSDHAWTEIFEDGRWKGLDPVAAALATNQLRDLGFKPHPDFAQACYGSSFNRFLPCRTSTAEPLLVLDDLSAAQWITCAISAKPWE